MEINSSESSDQKEKGKEIRRAVRTGEEGGHCDEVQGEKDVEDSGHPAVKLERALEGNAEEEKQGAVLGDGIQNESQHENGHSTAT